MSKKRIYIDMDGVICDYMKAFNTETGLKYPQSKWGFFLKLEPIPGAIEAINLLRLEWDVWILTRPSFKNVTSWTEKAQWIWDHLGYDMVEKTIMCGDKSLLIGDILIDDTSTAGQPNFRGEWIHFGKPNFENWDKVLKHLQKIKYESKN